MADAREIIDYIRTLRKGFDKDLFQCKINDLGYIVDTFNLDYRDFHTLYKLWLNLNIPIAKWTSFGVCLVPPDIISERTVDYALEWILANYDKQSNFVRIGFVLDWLTAALECNCIEVNSLDSGYELFYSMLSIEVLTPHVVRLIYILTKPSDVTRRRVIDLLSCARLREGEKNKYRQLQVLLGLFKSYKPEYVPENQPAISIHTAFKKLNNDLLDRFKRMQEYRNRSSTNKKRLIWINQMNSDRGNNKTDQLIPDMEFLHTNSKQYGASKSQKDFFDFSEPVSLIQHSLRDDFSRPAKLRALLCNDTGLMLLAIASHGDHSFLSHDLHHLLNTCFLEISKHSYVEKQNLLQKLALLQRTLMQGIPVITMFLAKYLPLWNELDYFPEILELVVWVSVDNSEHVNCIVGSLTRIYHRAQPLEQCAIARSLTAMYTNLVYASTRKLHYFMSDSQQHIDYDIIIQKIGSDISEMCNKGLQAIPDDMRVMYSGVWSAERITFVESRCIVRPNVLPGMLTLALPLLGISPTLIDKMAALILSYNKIFVRMISKDKGNHEEFSDQIEILQQYISDMLRCLYNNEALSERNNGLIFKNFHPRLVAKLDSKIPYINDQLSLRNHLAFAPYTYAQLQGLDDEYVTNKMWFDIVIEKEFPRLGKFLKKNIHELC